MGINNKLCNKLSRILMFVLAIVFLSVGSVGGCNNDNGNSTTVRQIGNLSSVLADDISAQVNLSPYEGGSNAAVILQGSTVLNLTNTERSGLKSTHEAGYTIVILDASKAHVDALHEVIEDGDSFTSSSDPVLLGYSTRKEDVFTARQLVTPMPGLIKQQSAIETSANIVVNDLLAKPGEITTNRTSAQTTETTVNVADKPVSVYQMSDPQPNNGAFNTTVKIYSLYQCQKTTTTGFSCSENPSNLDQYFITAEADWTPGSEWQSAAGDDLENNGLNQTVKTWRDGSDNCNGDNNTACRYINYPRFYELEMEVPSAPTGTVFQADAAPTSTAGITTTYTSGFTFSITGEVNIGNDPSVTASATWQNTTSTTTPPLTVDASNLVNEGAKWEFVYNPSTLQGKEGPNDDCEDELSDPQNGQTPDGKFSNAVQTVVWTSCPTGTDGFEVKIRFGAHMANTETLVWPVQPNMQGFNDAFGGGTCEDDIFGQFCDCQASNDEFDKFTDFTYTIKSPSTDCS